MWMWIKDLSPNVQTIVFLLIALVTIIVSVFGGLVFQRDKEGKIKVSLGRVKKRSCEDCRMLTRNQIQTADRKITKLESNVLKAQMNFAEQKLIELVSEITEKFSELLHRTSLPTDAINQEFKDFYETVDTVAFRPVKDEIRRAFKENGFYEMPAHDLTLYVQTESTVLLNKIKFHVQDHYRPRIALQCNILNLLNDLEPKIEKVVASIFNMSKEIKAQTDQTIAQTEAALLEELSTI